MDTEGGQQLRGGAPCGQGHEERRKPEAMEKVTHPHEAGPDTAAAPTGWARAEAEHDDVGVTGDDGSEDIGKCCPGVTQQAHHFRCVCAEKKLEIL
ncbi:hypothetical protein COCNU_01G006380 [Cocos nucifera]|uniref:Uncharacterized protein n=1 Tax=Cocos nucifera TaxID=13894 RepID=A0A8K0HV31_COCNU|nr:hypothetical protein COCNU_01G006380 [Cocos nucifera]